MKGAHPTRQVPAIRRAGPADLPGLVALCAAHAAYEGAAYAPDGQDERLRVALFGPSPRLHAWVAEGPEGLAGYMTATVDFATWTACSFVHMDCLYLREGARGAGLGRALVEVLCDFARRHGIGEIQWQTPASNALGIGFYRRLGAAEGNKLRYRLAVNPKAIPLPAVLGRAEATA